MSKFLRIMRAHGNRGAEKLSLGQSVHMWFEIGHKWKIRWRGYGWRIGDTSEPDPSVDHGWTTVPYYLLADGRLLIHRDSFQKSEFLPFGSYTALTPERLFEILIENGLEYE